MEVIILKLFVFLLISISCSHLWSHSVIMGYIRRKIVYIPLIRKPLLCPECSSFWVAFGITFIFNPLIDLICIPFLSNVFVSVISYTISGILYKKQILTDD